MSKRKSHDAEIEARVVLEAVKGECTVSVEGLKTGPKEPRSTILSKAKEATVVAFRQHSA